MISVGNAFKHYVVSKPSRRLINPHKRMRADFRFLQLLNLYPPYGTGETDRLAASETEQGREMSNSRPSAVIAGPVLSYDDA